MNLAPIILFVYNRPQHTLKTLEALNKNYLANESELYIFADGPRPNADENELQKIKDTREIVNSKEWCKRTIIIESEINKGLANSIIDGVSKIVNEQGKVIVLEDDLVTSPYFLQYMNDALNIYSDNDAVACISGYIYPLKHELPGTFFLKGADCWGWATWKRAWGVFEKDGSKLLNELNNQSATKKFDFDHCYPYTQMLKDQIAGKNDSWAIRWYASAFLRNMFCLYPGTSVVQNIGFDGSGTHSSNSDKWNVKISEKVIEVKKISVMQNNAAYDLFKSYFNTLKPSLLYRIKKIIKKRLNRY